MYYSNKRRQYLVDQGYAYKVVNNLFKDDTVIRSARHMRTEEEQLDLLGEVMSANADADEDEEQQVSVIVSNCGSTRVRYDTVNLLFLPGRSPSHDRC